MRSFTLKIHDTPILEFTIDPKDFYNSTKNYWSQLWNTLPVYFAAGFVMTGETLFIPLILLPIIIRVRRPR